MKKAPNTLVTDARRTGHPNMLGPRPVRIEEIEAALARLDRFDLQSDEACGYRCSARMEVVPNGDFVSYENVLKVLRYLAHPHA